MQAVSLQPRFLFRVVVVIALVVLATLSAPYRESRARRAVSAPILAGQPLRTHSPALEGLLFGRSQEDHVTACEIHRTPITLAEIPMTEPRDWSVPKYIIAREARFPNSDEPVDPGCFGGGSSAVFICRSCNDARDAWYAANTPVRSR
jgi:hypothetical protein